jgi:hypothetical protein
LDENTIVSDFQQHDKCRWISAIGIGDRNQADFGALGEAALVLE